MQARDGVNGGVGVQRGIHLMAGHGGAQGHACGVLITDFADQDDVGILPQQGAHAIGKIELDGFGQRGLAYARQGVFNRVFQRHDVDFGGVQPIEDGVQRGCLARAGGPGQQQQTGRAIQHALQQLQLCGGKSQLRQRHDAALVVEYAQYQFFAVNGGLHGTAKVQCSARNAQIDAAILGCTVFGDVHAGQNFQPDQHGRPICLRQHAYLTQDAINAIAQTQEMGFRLEMNI